MTRGAGALFVIGLSWYWVVTSLRKLWKHGLRRDFSIALSVIAAGALLLIAGFSWSWRRETGDMRVWGATPFIVFFIIYLFSGIFLREHVEALLIYKWWPERRPVRVVCKRRRARGAIFAVIGAGIWIYGIFMPFSANAYIWSLLGLAAAMVYGGLLLSEGVLHRRR